MRWDHWHNVCVIFKSSQRHIASTSGSTSYLVSIRRKDASQVSKWRITFPRLRQRPLSNYVKGFCASSHEYCVLLPERSSRMDISSSATSGPSSVSAVIFRELHCSWARRSDTRPLYNGWRGPARRSCQRIPDLHVLWSYLQIIVRCSIFKDNSLSAWLQSTPCVYVDDFSVTAPSFRTLMPLLLFVSLTELLSTSTVLLESVWECSVRYPPWMDRRHLFGLWWSEYHQKSDQVRRGLDWPWLLPASFGRVSWQVCESLQRNHGIFEKLGRTSDWLQQIYMRYPY